MLTASVLSCPSIEGHEHADIISFLGSSDEKRVKVEINEVAYLARYVGSIKNKADPNIVCRTHIFTAGEVIHARAVVDHACRVAAVAIDEVTIVALFTRFYETVGAARMRSRRSAKAKNKDQ
jgi:hypothetical protein